MRSNCTFLGVLFWRIEERSDNIGGWGIQFSDFPRARGVWVVSFLYITSGGVQIPGKKALTTAGPPPARPKSYFHPNESTPLRPGEAL